MKAVVLVAGKGTRMEPLTSDCPRSCSRSQISPSLSTYLIQP